MSPKSQAEKVVGLLARKYGELLNDSAIVYTQRGAWIVKDAFRNEDGTFGFRLAQAPAHLSYQSHGFMVNDRCVCQIVWEEGPYEWSLNNSFAVTDILRESGLTSFAEPYNTFVLDVYPD